MITIKDLQKIHSDKLINLRQLARDVNIDYQCLYSRIKRGSELKVNESVLISEVLKTKYNINL